MRTSLIAMAIGGVVLGSMVARPIVTASAEESAYAETPLVSSVAGLAPHSPDGDLKNPWGIVAGPATPFWISDNNAGVTTLYQGDGTKVMLKNGNSTIPHVNIPAPGGGQGAPTGVVFSRGKGFTATSNGTSGEAAFIFATEDGTIVAWAPGVDVANGIITVDNSAVPNAQSGAVYKGLALSSNKGDNLLYASNFRAATVDAFDTSFNKVDLGKHAFRDSRIPAGYAPFGIAATPQGILVSYAVQNAEKHDDVAGPQHGFVDLYSTSGVLLERLIRHGALNSPWGMVMAPDHGFGRFSGDLLVGNFGDGVINAYDSEGDFEGSVRGANGQPLVNDGLWGLSFGNGAAAGPTTTLFVTAGINHEADGLFAAITANPDSAGDH